MMFEPSNHLVLDYWLSVFIRPSSTNYCKLIYLVQRDKRGESNKKWNDCTDWLLALAAFGRHRENEPQLVFACPPYPQPIPASTTRLVRFQTARIGWIGSRWFGIEVLRTRPRSCSSSEQKNFEKNSLSFFWILLFCSFDPVFYSSPGAEACWHLDPVTYQRHLASWKYLRIPEISGESVRKSKQSWDVCGTSSVSAVCRLWSSEPLFEV